jgi:hypothetical protein
MSEEREARMVAEVGGLVDETGVCLAVYGASLEPDFISSRLGCKPTHAHRRGEQRSVASPPYSSGAWLLEVRGQAPSGPEELLRQLLERLPKDSDLWGTLAAEYDVQVRLGIHFTKWNKGFDLSPKVVDAIAGLRASLHFDIYAYGENGDA